MLLQQIVALLDRELDRLQRLRAIVAGLSGPSVVELPVRIEALSGTNSPDQNEAVAEETAAQQKPARRGSRQAKEQRTQDAPRQRKRAVEPGALQGPIPNAPVVVSAAALAREKDRTVREPRPPAPEPGTLGSMIRALHLEANS